MNEDNLLNTTANYQAKDFSKGLRLLINKVDETSTQHFSHCTFKFLLFTEVLSISSIMPTTNVHFYSHFY